MVNSIIASLALFGASAAAASVGKAHIVNKCNYDVKLCEVPAQGGGYQEVDKMLSAGESWTQDWTELSNGAGWSIKLSKTETLSNILQYEYTFHNDGTIWYDLSCVDGNPWDQDWEITASGSDCNPKQQAYRYATDDAYGMQSCPQDAAITVTLCTGVSADAGNSTEAAPSSDDDESSDEAEPAVVASTSTPAAAVPYVAPTTLTTVSTSAVVTEAPGGMTITEVVTAYVTATAYHDRWGKRHEHGHAQHAHQHNA